jgi:hypothetical protein
MIWLKMSKIEISEYGNLLMYSRGYSADFVKKTIRENQLNGLRIFDAWNRLESLEFLREFTFLEWLEITCSFDQDYDFLHYLPQLKHLSIGPSATMKNEIDISSQTNLEYLSLQWRKGKIRGIERCQRISDLCLVEYNEEDLSQMAALMKLSNLKIKTASFETLHGLENLTELNSVLLGYCKKLTSIRALNSKMKLKSLEIELCRQIKDYEHLTDLPSLEYLRLTDCNGIRSIGFVKNFPSLERIALLGNTNVLDGNIKPAKQIKEHFYSPRRHYH